MSDLSEIIKLLAELRTYRAIDQANMKRLEEKLDRVSGKIDQVEETVIRQEMSMTPILDAWQKWRGARWGLMVVVSILGGLFALVAAAAAAYEKARIFLSLEVR